MYVESERRVSALHGGHGAGEGLGHARQTVLALRAPAQGAVHLFHEAAHDFGAQLLVVPQQRAQAPGQRADPVTDGHARQHALF